MQNCKRLKCEIFNNFTFKLFFAKLSFYFESTKSPQMNDTSVNSKYHRKRLTICGPLKLEAFKKNVKIVPKCQRMVHFSLVLIEMLNNNCFGPAKCRRMT